MYLTFGQNHYPIKFSCTNPETQFLHSTSKLTAEFLNIMFCALRNGFPKKLKKKKKSTMKILAFHDWMD